MIPDFKTYIGESVWSDIHKRSNGEKERKEDNVDLLDRLGLMDYLKKHYKELYGSGNFTTTVGLGGTITVCLCEDTDGYYQYIFIEDLDNDPKVYLCDTFKELCEDIYKELEDKYTVHITKDYKLSDLDYIRIEPKGCRYLKLSNSFFLQVLDFILDRIELPLIRQIEKI